MWGDFHPWGRDNRRSTHQSPRRLCRRAHLSNIWDEWAEIRHGKAIHQVFRTASFLYSVRSSPYFRSQIIFYLHSMPHYSALKWETERTRGSDAGWQWGWWGGGGVKRIFSSVPRFLKWGKHFELPENGFLRELAAGRHLISSSRKQAESQRVAGFSRLSSDRREKTTTKHCFFSLHLQSHFIILQLQCTYLSRTVYSLSVLNRATSLASIIMYVFPVVLSEGWNKEIRHTSIFFWYLFCRAFALKKKKSECFSPHEATRSVVNTFVFKSKHTAEWTGREFWFKSPQLSICRQLSFHLNRILHIFSL